MQNKIDHGKNFDTNFTQANQSNLEESIKGKIKSLIYLGGLSIFCDVQPLREFICNEVLHIDNTLYQLDAHTHVLISVTDIQLHHKERSPQKESSDRNSYNNKLNKYNNIDENNHNNNSNNSNNNNKYNNSSNSSNHTKTNYSTYQHNNDSIAHNSSPNHSVRDLLASTEPAQKADETNIAHQYQPTSNNHSLVDVKTSDGDFEHFDVVLYSTIQLTYTLADSRRELDQASSDKGDDRYSAYNQASNHQTDAEHRTSTKTAEEESLRQRIDRFVISKLQNQSFQGRLLG